MDATRVVDPRLRVARALLPLALWVAACQSPGSGVQRASDRYEECDSATAQRAVGDALGALAKGDPAAALPLLEQALTECPERAATHVLYAQAAKAAGKSGIERLQHFYDGRDDGRSPVWPFARALLADEPFYRQQLLEQALQRDSTFYWARLELARMWRSLHRTSNALEQLDAALAARPSFAAARLERAEVLGELGRYEEAARDYADYLTARPGDRAVIREYARLLIYRLDRDDDAAPLVEGLLQEQPDDVALQMDRAAVRFDSAPREALSIYRDVLARDPANAHAVLNIGNLCFDRLGRKSSASRERWWPVARTAYRIYLASDRPQGPYDFLDQVFSVPYRLQRIDHELAAGAAGDVSVEALLQGVDAALAAS